MDAVIPFSLDAFLANVERRAYRMALLATREPADALDIVQDTMLNLVQNYRQRPHQEWGPLFQRILQNRILDWHRARARGRRWFAVMNSGAEEDGDEADPIAQIADAREDNPADLLARADDVDAVLKALEDLPLRQRQVFLLRAWEGFGVAATAAAMDCSEGSVKTHYFRALHTLRAALEEEEENSERS